MMVRDFQSVIGEEIKSQLRNFTKRSPHALICCVGGGSNAMSTFFPFLDDKDVSIWGWIWWSGHQNRKTFPTLNEGSEGILHGMRTYLLQDEFGQINDTHSISASWTIQMWDLNMSS